MIKIRKRALRAGVLPSIATAITAAWMTSLSVAAGQAPAVPTTGWSARTPWGDPDLQGVWTTWDETPLQAQDAAAAAEAARATQRAAGVYEAGENQGSGGGMSRIHFSPVSARRPALVVDPPNGRIPVIPGKPVRRDTAAMGDTWEAHTGWERCVAKGLLGRNLEPGGDYDKAYRILQIPGYVIIAHEQIHDARIIPLDGRRHVGSDIKLWHGDSRGRWEGQTLVVDTTNFNDKGGGYGGAHQTQALRLVERYTRVDEKTLNFEVTFNDPSMYSQPWTARAPHNLDPKYVIYEYACHEGNANYMEGSLKAGRVRDAEEAAAAAKKASGR